MILARGFNTRKKVTIPGCIRGMRTEGVFLNVDDVTNLLNMHEDEMIKYLQTLKHVLTPVKDID